MDKGFFYFISDTYYKKFGEEPLMNNKNMIDGEMHNRPCYYAFQDDTDHSIFWMIPVSSQTDKYKKEFDKRMERYGLCDTISFGFLKGKYTAFLLQNMCPVTEKYILNKYLVADTSKPINIPKDLKRELNKKARKIIRLSNNGKQLTFTNIYQMKCVLLSETN
jgi:hypothetical protein